MVRQDLVLCFKEKLSIYQLSVFFFFFFLSCLDFQPPHKKSKRPAGFKGFGKKSLSRRKRRGDEIIQTDNNAGCVIIISINIY